MELGVGYSDGTQNVLFGFKDAIVEYRSNIGVVKTATTNINVPQACYGKTYLSIGIPERRYDFIYTEISERFGS
jgi:hypothetical protein